VALEDTMVLYKSSGDGPFGSVLVPRNAARLEEKLDLGLGNWTLADDNYDHLDCPFSEDQYVWSGKEKIKCGDPPEDTIIRAQGGTADANHPKASFVFPDYATIPASSKILDITVGAEGNGLIVTAIRCVGFPGPGNFIIDINGTVIATPVSSLDHREVFWPWSGSVLSTGNTIKVFVINLEPECLFRAEVIK